MKNVLLFLVFYSCLNYSQNLSFDEFLSLKNKNTVEVNLFFKGKGWHLFSELKPQLDKQGIIVFKMEKQKSNVNFWNGETLIECYSYKNANVSKLRFTTASKEIFNSYLTHIKKLNYKVVSSSIKDKVNNYTYQNDKLIIKTEDGSFFKKKCYVITVTDKY
jgi:hypothetical protein